MTTTAAAPAQPYRGLAGCYDEMLAADGTVRDHWTGVEQVLAELGPKELSHRRREVHRLLREDSVTHSTYGTLQGGEGGEGGDEARWRLDPVPVVLSSNEWASLEAGIIQRAELLNLVLEDIYGDRDLLRQGPDTPGADLRPSWLPPSLRPAARPRSPSAVQLRRRPGARRLRGPCRALGPQPDPIGIRLRPREPDGDLPGLPEPVPQLRRSIAWRRSSGRCAWPSRPRPPRSSMIPVSWCSRPGPGASSAFEHAFLASQLGLLARRGGRPLRPRRPGAGCVPSAASSRCTSSCADSTPASAIRSSSWPTPNSASPGWSRPAGSAT